MSTEQDQQSQLATISNALVRLHKEQFGRGPTRARTYWAGSDALVSILEDALLPAEEALVAMGEQHRVREARMFLQVATAKQFTKALEELVGREVVAFASASDPDRSVVFENYLFAPAGDGSAP
jgi:uncharacterized protein YbcI